MLWHGKYRLSEGVSVRIPCQWSQFSRPSISRISPPPPSKPLSHQESLLEEKNNRWTPREKIGQKRVSESFCDERGRKSCQEWAPITADDVPLEWKAAVADPTFIKSAYSNFSDELCLSTMSCVYRIVYKHPDEPFPFVWFCQKIIIKWISMLRSHHIITDLSTTAVLWEVMQKLQQSWIQHHPLHIH